MALGLYALYATTGTQRWFDAASSLVAQIPDRFGDGQGGLYSSEPSTLIRRPRDLFDNPSPSGTSLAAEATLIASLYTGDQDMRERAETYLRMSGTLIERYPSAAGHAMAVIASLGRGTHELAVVGPSAGEFGTVFWKRYRPHIVLAQSLDQVNTSAVPLLMGRGKPGTTLAYLCSGFVCLTPVATADELEELLDNT
jgi:hypothetical protein